jgi:hypothetical protein
LGISHSNQGVFNEAGLTSISNIPFSTPFIQWISLDGNGLEWKKKTTKKPQTFAGWGFNGLL